MSRAAILTFAATVWAVLILTAPTIALGVPASAFTYTLGSFICHQRPERSFHLAAAQLPVCARCTGVYVGAAIGAWFVALKGCATAQVWRTTSAPRGPAVRTLRLVLIAGAIPTVLTWLLEEFGIVSPGNVVRALAALPLGAAIACAVTLNYERCVRPPRNGFRPPPTPFSSA